MDKTRAQTLAASIVWDAKAIFDLLEGKTPEHPFEESAGIASLMRELSPKTPEDEMRDHIRDIRRLLPMLEAELS